MRPWLVRGGVAVVVVALAAAVWFVWALDAAGQLRSLEPMGPDECTAVRGASGVEDLVADRNAGVAILSADPRQEAAETAEPGAELGAQAGLFLYDLGGDAGSAAQAGDVAAIRPLPHDFAGELRPHGISLLPSGEDSVLMVVNHAGGEHTVEQFQWHGDRASHRGTVRDPLLISPNDVAALDDRRFYATNDHGAAGGLSRTFEDLFYLRRSNVVFWNGDEMRVVAAGIGYANGVALSPDGRSLFVAATTEGAVHEYLRDEESGDLELVQTFELGTGVDNITVDAHGSLWIAAHPHLLSFLRHASDPSRRSPSEVVWVDPLERSEPFVRSVWLDLGERISGSSVVVPVGARFVVGSVFEPWILVCQR